MPKRRGNNEGSLTLLKSGLWQARVSHEGKRIAAYGRTKAEAQQKIRALQRRQEDGLPLVTSGMKLQDYLDLWLEGITHQVRPKTLYDYTNLVRCHLAPRLGQTRLNRLTPEHVQRAWTEMLKDGHSPSLVEHCHLRLSKALNDAMRRNLVYRNPCQMVSPPKAERKGVNPPGAEEITRLLETARDTEYYEAIYTSFYTGLRRGELLALQWRDVDLAMGTLSVTHSLYRASGGRSILQEPKTAKGRRLVDLTPSNTLLLRSLWDRQVTDGLLQGYTVGADSPVFRYRDGSPILPRGYSGAFSKIMRKAGLEGYRLHDARHSHATLMLKQGVHPKIVQERLGHAKVSITLDLYSHVTPGLQQAAALRFEEGLTDVRPVEPIQESIGEQLA